MRLPLPAAGLRRSAAWHLARCGLRFGTGYFQPTAYGNLNDDGFRFEVDRYGVPQYSGDSDLFGSTAKGHGIYGMDVKDSRLSNWLRLFTYEQD